MPSRLAKTIGAFNADTTGAKMAAGLAGRLGELPSSVSPTATKVAGPSLVVVVVTDLSVVAGETEPPFDPPPPTSEMAETASPTTNNSPRRPAAIRRRR